MTKKVVGQYNLFFYRKCGSGPRFQNSLVTQPYLYAQSKTLAQKCAD